MLDISCVQWYSETKYSHNDHDNLIMNCPPTQKQTHVWVVTATFTNAVLMGPTNVRITLVYAEMSTSERLILGEFVISVRAHLSMFLVEWRLTPWWFPFFLLLLISPSLSSSSPHSLFYCM